LANKRKVLNLRLVKDQKVISLMAVFMGSRQIRIKPFKPLIKKPRIKILIVSKRQNLKGEVKLQRNH